MTYDEQGSLRERLKELALVTEKEMTAAAIILLTDRLVGMLDGILARLRAIEDSLENIGVS